MKLIGAPGIETDKRSPSLVKDKRVEGQKSPTPNPFLSNLLLIIVFYHSNRSLKIACMNCQKKISKKMQLCILKARFKKRVLKMVLQNINALK